MHCFHVLKFCLNLLRTVWVKVNDSSVSEFLTNVSRGKLSYPPSDLYDFSLYCYAFFKVKCERKNCCSKIFLQAYKLIYESTDYNFENIDSIVRRFSNSFFNANH